MRFLLLARTRSGGHVRLLSDRAFDTRSEAVDAAGVTAVGMDLADDEVLAIDLDSADPVLVLRIGTAPTTVGANATAGAEVEEASPEMQEAIASFFAPRPAPTESPRPRLALFGPPEPDGPQDITLSETLREVARRMEADLCGVSTEEPNRLDEDWDARTNDDYSLPGNGALDDSREEGRGRSESAENLHSGDYDTLRDEFPASDNDPFTDAYVDLAAETTDRVGEAPADVGMAPAWWDVRGAEPLAAEVVAETEVDIPTGVEVDVDGTASEWFAADEPVSEPHEPRTADAAPDADRVENPVVEWEPPTVYYHPANTDFAVWVCADCVYQRTCRKAGIATPSTCGNFLWRSH